MMAPLRFQYTTTLLVRMPYEDVSSLITICSQHYDLAVRGLAEPGVGAVLNGAMNRFKGEIYAEVEFSYQQLDLLAKALERNDAARYAQVQRLMALVAHENESANRFVHTMNRLARALAHIHPELDDEVVPE